MDLKEQITIKDWLVLNRYFYHRPPMAHQQFAIDGKGLEAYHNRNHDLSTPSIERAFNATDPKILWLAKNPNDYDGSYIVDLTKLDPENIEPTFQAEGNIWHKGNIPPEAVVGLVE